MVMSNEQGDGAEGLIRRGPRFEGDDSRLEELVSESVHFELFEAGFWTGISKGTGYKELGEKIQQFFDTNYVLRMDRSGLLVPDGLEVLHGDDGIKGTVWAGVSLGYGLELGALVYHMLASSFFITPQILVADAPFMFNEAVKREIYEFPYMDSEHSAIKPILDEAEAKVKKEGERYKRFLLQQGLNYKLELHSGYFAKGKRNNGKYWELREFLEDYALNHPKSPLTQFFEMITEFTAVKYLRSVADSIDKKSKAEKTHDDDDDFQEKYNLARGWLMKYVIAEVADILIQGGSRNYKAGPINEVPYDLAAEMVDHVKDTLGISHLIPEPREGSKRGFLYLPYTLGELRGLFPNRNGHGEMGKEVLTEVRLSRLNDLITHFKQADSCVLPDDLYMQK